MKRKAQGILEFGLLLAFVAVISVVVFNMMHSKAGVENLSKMSSVKLKSAAAVTNPLSPSSGGGAGTPAGANPVNPSGSPSGGDLPSTCGSNASYGSTGGNSNSGGGFSPIASGVKQ